MQRTPYIPTPEGGGFTAKFGKTMPRMELTVFCERSGTTIKPKYAE